MDLTETIAANSDQIGADDLLSGPRTFTVEKVTKGSAEQPVDIHLAEYPGRPFRPSKTVRRILVTAWGKETSEYIGRRMTLFRDDTVRYGGADVGGVRVSHLSHIDKPLTISLTETRGKKKPHRVEPLADEPPSAETPSLGALFDRAGLPKARGDDRITVTRKIVGRPDIASAADLTKDELASLTAQLAEWDRDGTLTDKVGDILDLSAIEAEGAGDTK